MGQKPINESRQMASKIKVVKIGQYTVFPRGVVSFFQIKENGKNVFFFWQKHYECNYQIETDDLQCYGSSENRTAARPVNLWIPRPTSIGCSPSSPSFCTSNWLKRCVYSYWDQKNPYRVWVSQLWWLLSKRAEKFSIPKWS